MRQRLPPGVEDPFAHDLRSIISLDSSEVALAHELVHPMQGPPLRVEIVEFLLLGQEGSLEVPLLTVPLTGLVELPQHVLGEEFISKLALFTFLDGFGKGCFPLHQEPPAPYLVNEASGFFVELALEPVGVQLGEEPSLPILLSHPLKLTLLALVVLAVLHVPNEAAEHSLFKPLEHNQLVEPTFRLVGRVPLQGVEAVILSGEDPPVHLQSLVDLETRVPVQCAGGLTQVLRPELL
mmetsp:Transcript_13367/g.20889  ORF Transcript_13367/g.20889 Transcript_13367/m.20889 type:complete len:237 (-) Transcript_13367:2870-3580(-)